MKHSRQVNPLRKSSKTVWRFAGDRSGQFGVVLAITALPLTVGVGMAIDMGLMMRNRTSLQDVADAVAIASVRGLRTSRQFAEAEGRAVYSSLMQRLRLGLVSENVTFVFAKSPDYTSHVEITAKFQGVFGRMLNINLMQHTVDATASLGAQSVELMFALDVSYGLWGPEKEAAFKIMTDVAEKAIENAGDKDAVRIGFVPYSFNVALPEFASEWVSAGAADIKAHERACLDADDLDTLTETDAPRKGDLKLSAAFPKDCPAVPVIPLTTKAAFETEMRQRFFNQGYWSRLYTKGAYELGGYGNHIGASWAARMIDPEWRPLLPKAAAPGDDGAVNKIVVLLPMTMPSAKNGTKTGNTATGIQEALAESCAAMQKRGVTVYTLLPPNHSYLQKSMKVCAGPEHTFIGKLGGGGASGAGSGKGNKGAEGLVNSIGNSVSSGDIRLVR